MRSCCSTHPSTTVSRCCLSIRPPAACRGSCASGGPLPMPNRVFVCADDFAAPGEDAAAVAALVERGRVSALSCFTESPAWRRQGALVRALDCRALLGLHFDL